jgi:hypothetical protein
MNPKYNSFYVEPKPKPAPQVPTDQLIQLLRIVYDGDLISKSDRDVLVGMSFCTRSEGFNIITSKGISHLYKTGRLSN